MSINRDKNGKEVTVGAHVEWDVYGPGPGLEHAKPVGTLKGVAILVDTEVYIDVSRDPNAREVLYEAGLNDAFTSPEHIGDDSLWGICSNSEMELIVHSELPVKIGLCPLHGDEESFYFPVESTTTKCPVPGCNYKLVTYTRLENNG